jgi:hypothetical protein
MSSARWRPIETAPTSGRPVLLFLDPPLSSSCLAGYAVPGELTMVVGWARDSYSGYYEWNCGACDEGTADTEGYSFALPVAVTPTHWMPLPDAPEQARAAS